MCNAGTRVQILAEIKEWAITPTHDTTLGYWMYEMVGTGKSTIAMPTCKMPKDGQHLVTTFSAPARFRNVEIIT